MSFKVELAGKVFSLACYANLKRGFWDGSQNSMLSVIKSRSV